MMPMYNLRALEEYLSMSFESRYQAGRTVNLVGILVARPESDYAKTHVLPHLNYWHHRSDNITDFFCPGYQEANPYRNAPVVVTVGGQGWEFDTEAFVRLVGDIEGRFDWNYSGGCELILLNARATGNGRAVLDPSSALVIDFEKAQAEGAVRDAAELFELVWEGAKAVNERQGDPASFVSDRIGVRREIPQSLKDLLIGVLPEALRPRARSAVHFAARDLSRR